MDDEKIPIEITPNSLKWGGGVLFGVGEYFRSKLANIKMVDFITRAKHEGWSDEALAKKISNISKLVDREIARRLDGREEPDTIEEIVYDAEKLEKEVRKELNVQKKEETGIPGDTPEATGSLPSRSVRLDELD